MKDRIITSEELRKAIEYVLNEDSKPKERGMVLMGYCRGLGRARNYAGSGDGLCSHPECTHCRMWQDELMKEAKNWATKELGKILTPTGISQVIEKYRQELGLIHLEIKTESILREQVMYPDDIPLKDKYFVGVAVKDNVAIISHDRDLFEDDILHELLHLAYPDKDEDWINAETDRILKNKKQ